MNDLEEGFLKAYDTLESAKILLETGFESGAVNRIYYAYFWAVRGLLSQKDIFVKSHTGTQTKFAETYIKTGIIPEKYGKYLGRLEDKRTLADYEAINDFTKEEVKEMISWTEDFLAFVKENIEKLL
ncbi:uncharacterized protein (UPF0332 family) [Arcicella aurantiaca]|jgi:uncharacterized protein (UPF0332 family)|uniref:Uncharacterized protein (UPF0332 family) n=1 Tax=Arcicella aurantiaca TaxID=591202 RepID=A0A316E0D6_9BACT|nr:HEPN domain-containing protein [Arcicella aurantiaca]PWK22949.1 uncharacterized protein (UPF0332 family) [Arcicella aurantiaca]